MGAGQSGAELAALQYEGERELLVNPDAGLVVGAPEDADPSKLYEDPALGEHRTYHDFVQRLLEAGLVVLDPEVQYQTVRAFFIRKKGGHLRLIIDWREVNRLCQEPPKTQLGSRAHIATTF